MINSDPAPSFVSTCNSPPMRLYEIVAHAQSQARSYASGFGGKKGLVNFSGFQFSIFKEPSARDIL